MFIDMFKFGRWFVKAIYYLLQQLDYENFLYKIFVSNFRSYWYILLKILFVEVLERSHIL